MKMIACIGLAYGPERKDFLFWGSLLFGTKMKKSKQIQSGDLLFFLEITTYL